MRKGEYSTLTNDIQFLQKMNIFLIFPHTNTNYFRGEKSGINKRHQWLDECSLRKEGHTDGGKRVMS